VKINKIGYYVLHFPYYVCFYFDKIFRKCLQIVYHFDSWHTAPLCAKKYVRDIVHFLNGLGKRNVYIEIGCGLGDIIRNIKYKYRIGYDIDQHVLNAASFLSRMSVDTNICFSRFVFPVDTLNISDYEWGGGGDNKADSLVLVNWIHNIEPDILKNKLYEYFNNNIADGGVIIIDTVGDKSYRFTHDINYLVTGLYCEVKKIGSYEYQREVWAIIKKNDIKDSIICST